MTQLSHDRELFKQLKRRFPWKFSRNFYEKFNAQGRLVQINLAVENLTQLPPELFQFTSLQELALQGNQLSSLSPKLGQLSSLQRLTLYGNQLSSLPPELSQLSSLQTLHLWSNQLRSLPPELGQLSSLQTLDLSSNQLRSLPPELGQLSSLQTLHLSSNQLSSLPPELGQLSSLQTLTLYDNQLSGLPPELGQLSSLQHLELWRNQLSSIPLELGQLSSLQTLNLSSNQLSSLPPELGQLSFLQKLDLSSNQFSSLPPELSQLSSLESLLLDQNPQLQIPPPEATKLGTPAVLGYLRALLQVEAKSRPMEESSIPLLSSSGTVLNDEISKVKNSMKPKETLPLKIFYCYAHEDRDLRDRIDKHLSILKHLGQIVGWYDREIQAGTEWEREIEENLDTASLILLLVSADFVASDYCYGVEMTKALELHRTGQARVLPILLRSVDWQGAPFATLQMLPTGAKPIMQWKDQDEALEDVAKGIRNAINSLRTHKK
jgi:Leucine-rich repeat (LRR) protein